MNYFCVLYCDLFQSLLAFSILAFSILLFVQMLLITSIGDYLYRWPTALIVGQILCYTLFAGTTLGLVIAWHSVFRRKRHLRRHQQRGWYNRNRVGPAA